MAPSASLAVPAAESPDPLVLESFLWGLLSASSLNIGSIIGVTCLPKRKARAVLMAFGGGALLFALSVELFGHVLHVSDTTQKRTPVWIMEGAAVAGGLLFALLNRFLNGFGADFRKASTTKGRLARMRAMLMRRLAVRLWNVPFFSTLSLDELKDLIQYAMYKERFNPGDIIMSETHESGIYFIISGMVRLQIRDDEKKKKALEEEALQDGDSNSSGFDSTVTPYTWDIGPNHIFGDMTVLTGSYVSTIVEALETTKVLVLPGHEVSRLLDENASVRSQVSFSTVERLRQLKEFSNLPTCALASLSSRASHGKFQPGEIIFSGTVDSETPVLAVALGSVELIYPMTGTRKTVHASCLICTEHFKGKDCVPFTAVASAASFVLILPRDALEEAMCMSPKQEKYVWNSQRTKKLFEERHSLRRSGSDLEANTISMQIPEDNDKVFSPSQKPIVVPLPRQTSEMSIEVVDTSSDDDNLDRWTLPGQVNKEEKPIKGSAKEILALGTIEPLKSKEPQDLSDVASTGTSTPALEPEKDHHPPESVHPTPNEGKRGSQQSLLTLGESTEVEMGRLPNCDFSSLGQHLGWDGAEDNSKEAVKKEFAVSKKLARGKSMLEIAQVTDQELTEQEFAEAENDFKLDVSPIANGIRSLRRGSKATSEYALSIGLPPRSRDSQDVQAMLPDVEENSLMKDMKVSTNQLMPPQAMGPRPSITRTRTPSKQRCEIPGSKEAAPSPRNSLRSMEGNEQKPKAHSSSQHAAIMIWLGILIDAVPESLVIGILVNRSATKANESAASAALPFVISVFLSNLPEAMSSSGSMKAHGMGVGKILLMWFVTTFLTAIGALIGAVAFPPSTITDESTQLVVSGVEGLAAGAMLTMIAQTMMPEAFEQGGDIVGLSCLAGFLCAMSVKLIPV